MVRIKLIGLILTLFPLYVLGQDMQFTQLNAAPLYLNPAFTGSTLHHRIASSYRNQWTGIPGNFVNYVFAYDYNIAELNSGVGFLFARERAGSGNLGNTELGLLYSYQFRIKKNIFVKPGIKFNLIQHGVDFNKLRFNDQLISGGNTSESIATQRLAYLDVASGVLVYMSNSWLGVSFNHMNKPDQSITQVAESPLPMKLSIHGGHKFTLPNRGDEESVPRHVNAAFQYKSQGEFDQLDLGVYYSREPVVFGLWFRGIPLFKSYDSGIANNDALALILGYSVPGRNLNIGYSYDVTLSRLSLNTGGSHELSIVYEVASKKKKRRRRNFNIPCAKF